MDPASAGHRWRNVRYRLVLRLPLANGFTVSLAENFLKGQSGGNSDRGSVITFVLILQRMCDRVVNNFAVCLACSFAIVHVRHVLRGTEGYRADKRRVRRDVTCIDYAG